MASKSGEQAFRVVRVDGEHKQKTLGEELLHIYYLCHFLLITSWRAESSWMSFKFRCLKIRNNKSTGVPTAKTTREGLRLVAPQPATWLHSLLPSGFGRDPGSASKVGGPVPGPITGVGLVSLESHPGSQSPPRLPTSHEALGRRSWVCVPWLVASVSRPRSWDRAPWPSGGTSFAPQIYFEWLQLGFTHAIDS